MNIYNINFDRLIKLVCIRQLQKTIVLLFLGSFMLPVITVYLAFLEYRRQALYRLNHNSQVCYLEAALNDAFDINDRRIRIANVEYLEPVYFHEPEVNDVVYFPEIQDDDTVYFSEPTDFSGSIDFTVLVPMDLQPASIEALNAFIVKMKGIVDYYKLYSKTYDIVWHTN